MGLATRLKTVSASAVTQTSAALTDNSGGTASATLADITEANNAGSADRVPVENAIASLAAQVNAHTTEIGSLVTLTTQLRTAVNADA